MKTQNVKTITPRSFLVAAAALGTLLFVSITPSFGQKEVFEAKRSMSRDGLIDTGYMTKADVSDDLDGSEDEYFYKFQAGPGKLTVTLEVDANETNAGAYLDLFDANNKPILQNMLVQAADRGSDRGSQSVKLSKKQDIIIRIKGIKYGSSGGYTGTYKILLEGPAVNFRDLAPADALVEVKKPGVAPPDGPSQDKKPEATSPDGPGEEEVPILPATGGKNKKPDVAPPAETGTGEKPDVIDRVTEKGKKKSKKVLNILDKVRSKIPD